MVTTHSIPAANVYYAVCFGTSTWKFSTLVAELPFLIEQDYSLLNLFTISALILFTR